MTAATCVFPGSSARACVRSCSVFRGCYCGSITCLVAYQSRSLFCGMHAVFSFNGGSALAAGGVAVSAVVSTQIGASLSGAWCYCRDFTISQSPDG